MPHFHPSGGAWEFYYAMLGVQGLQAKNTDDVVAHYLSVAREALDAAAARVEELDREDAA